MRSFAADERGATAIEYGLICSLIVLVVVAGMQAFGIATNTMYGTITAALASVF
jgi:pilus assembly protein Flp/PilA